MLQRRLTIAHEEIEGLENTISTHEKSVQGGNSAANAASALQEQQQHNELKGDVADLKAASKQLLTQVTVRKDRQPSQGSTASRATPKSITDHWQNVRPASNMQCQPVTSPRPPTQPAPVAVMTIDKREREVEAEEEAFSEMNVKLSNLKASDTDTHRHKRVMGDQKPSNPK